MTLCKCGDTGLNNTGTPSSICNPGRIQLMIAVPKFGSNGDRNSILVTDTIDQAYIDSKINAVDPADRWYPISGAWEQVENLRADDTTEDSDGITRITAKGLKAFSGRDYAAASKQYADVQDSLGCSEFGFYTLDGDNNLEGVISSDCTQLYPALVEKNTLSAKYIDPTQSTAAYIQLNFTWNQLLKDGSLYFIEGSEITGDIAEASGLIDVTIENATVPSVTEVTFDTKTKYGSFKVNGLAWVGAPVTAFEIFNQTSSSVVVPSGIVENTDGNYTLTYAAQTVADILIIRSASTAGEYNVSGYEITPFTLAAIV